MITRGAVSPAGLEDLVVAYLSQAAGPRHRRSPALEVQK
jgi:hypothetical protein